MIDEKNLIEKLEMLRFFNQRAGRELCQDKQKAVQDIDIENADEILSFAIESLRKREWVPCSERLPEKPVDVLVDFVDANPIIAWYSSVNDIWKNSITDHVIHVDVVAWMPLPEPYQMNGE